MTGLTDAEREALLTPCGCGHTINNHGSLCWVCADDGGPTDCTTDFEALLVERVAGIVDGRVAARLAPIEALAAEWETTSYRLPPGHPMTVNEFCRYWFKSPLRAALAESQGAVSK